MPDKHLEPHEEVPIALAIRVATRATSEQLNSLGNPLAEHSLDQRPRWSKVDGVAFAIDRMQRRNWLDLGGTFAGHRVLP